LFFYKTHNSKWSTRIKNGNAQAYIAHHSGYGMYLNSGSVSNGRYALLVRSTAYGNIIRANNNGMVGIGQGVPKSRLHIGEQLLFSSPSAAGGWGGIGKNIYWDNGIKRVVNDEVADMTFTDTGDIIFRSAPAGGTIITNIAHNMIIKNGGGVDVCGILTASEIIVEENWCDFVFEDDYNLPTLNEEKKNIEKLGHLIGFKSEEKMNGQIQMGDVTKRQQQKIEESVLHLINHEEEIQRLQKENEKLQEELNEIKEIVMQLQSESKQ